MPENTENTTAAQPTEASVQTPEGWAKALFELKAVDEKLQNLDSVLGALRGRLEAGSSDSSQAAVQAVSQAAQESVAACEERLSGRLGRIEEEHRRFSEDKQLMEMELGTVAAACKAAQEVLGAEPVRMQAFKENLERGIAARLDDFSNELSQYRDSGDGVKKEWGGMLENLMYEVQDKISGAMEIVSQDFKQAVSRGDKTAQELQHCVEQLKRRSEAVEARLEEIWGNIEDGRLGYQEIRSSVMEEIKAVREQFCQRIDDRISGISTQIDVALQAHDDLKTGLKSELEKTAAELSVSTEELRRKISSEMEAVRQELGVATEERLSQLSVRIASEREVQQREAAALEGSIHEIGGRLESSVGECRDGVRVLNDDLARKAEEWMAGLAGCRAGMESLQEQGVRVQKLANDLGMIRNDISEQQNESRSARQDIRLIASNFDSNQKLQKRAFTVAAVAVIMLQFGVLFVADNSRFSARSGAPETQALAEAKTAAEAADAGPGQSAANLTDTARPDSRDGIHKASDLPQPDLAGRIEEAFQKEDVSGFTNEEDSKRFTEYVVKKGDSLWLISKKHYGSSKHDKKIMQDNKLKSAEIRPGLILKLYSL